MEKYKKYKKYWDIGSTVLVTITVIAAVLLMGARLIGLQVYTILSGSMSPVYQKDDLIYVQKVDAASVKVNDVITYVLNEDLDVVTHRVVRIDSEKQHIYTKGDANDTEDKDPVHFKNVIGKPVFRIPLLGRVSNYIQTPPGMYITIGVGVLLLVLVFMPNPFAKKKGKAEAAEEEAPTEELPAETVVAAEEAEEAEEAKEEAVEETVSQ